VLSWNNDLEWCHCRYGLLLTRNNSVGGFATRCICCSAKQRCVRARGTTRRALLRGWFWIVARFSSKTSVRKRLNPPDYRLWGRPLFTLIAWYFQTWYFNPACPPPPARAIQQSEAHIRRRTFDACMGSFDVRSEKRHVLAPPYLELVRFPDPFATLFSPSPPLSSSSKYAISILLALVPRGIFLGEDPIPPPSYMGVAYFRWERDSAKGWRPGCFRCIWASNVFQSWFVFRRPRSSLSSHVPNTASRIGWLKLNLLVSCVGCTIGGLEGAFLSGGDACMRGIELKVPRFGRSSAIHVFFDLLRYCSPVRRHPPTLLIEIPHHQTMHLQPEDATHYSSSNIAPPAPHPRKPRTIERKRTTHKKPIIPPLPAHCCSLLLCSWLRPSNGLRAPTNYCFRPVCCAPRSTLFCCWPLGLYAISTSRSVGQMWETGDFDVGTVEGYVLPMCYLRARFDRFGLTWQKTATAPPLLQGHQLLNNHRYSRKRGGTFEQAERTCCKLEALSQGGGEASTTAEKANCRPPPPPPAPKFTHKQGARQASDDALGTSIWAIVIVYF